MSEDNPKNNEKDFLEQSDEQPPVICLDNSQLILDLLAKVCEPRGLALLQSGDVVGALDMIRNVGASLIITGYQLPDFLGTSLVAALRASPTHNEIPIAMITSKPLEVELPKYAEPNVIIHRNQLRKEIGKFFDDSGFPVGGRSGSSASKESDGPLRVLLSEDSPIIQFLVKKVLGSANVELKITNNGKEAVDALEETTFDLVLMDIEMPEMDGREAVTVIRKRGLELPVVALTGHDAKQFEAEARSLGFSDVIQKPINPAALLSYCGQYSRGVGKKAA